MLRIWNCCFQMSQVKMLFSKKIKKCKFDFLVDQFGNKGVWTIIYNQGFEVTINSRRYFAFSNWTAVERHQVMSRCNETKPGWSHDIYVRDWSCFVGKKQGQQPILKVHDDFTR